LEDEAEGGFVVAVLVVLGVYEAEKFEEGPEYEAEEEPVAEFVLARAK
jgi:hypothetical protein